MVPRNSYDGMSRFVPETGRFSGTSSVEARSLFNSRSRTFASQGKNRYPVRSNVLPLLGSQRGKQATKHVRRLQAKRARANCVIGGMNIQIGARVSVQGVGRTARAQHDPCYPFYCWAQWSVRKYCLMRQKLPRMVRT